MSDLDEGGIRGKALRRRQHLAHGWIHNVLRRPFPVLFFHLEQAQEKCDALSHLRNFGMGGLKRWYAPGERGEKTAATKVALGMNSPVCEQCSG